MNMENINVLFKKMQRDDKKEVLQFHLMDSNDAAEAELMGMAGEIVTFSIEGCDAGEVTAEFKSVQRDTKKTVINLVMKGDSDKAAKELYLYAGRNVNLGMKESQMSLDEFHEPHEGVTGTIDKDGTATVDPNQAELPV